MIEIESIRIILLLSMLGVASYFDIKTRMIPDVIWLICGGIGVVLYVFDWNIISSYHILSVIVTGTIVLLLYLYKWTGVADIFAIFCMAVILPVRYGFVMLPVVILLGGFVIFGIVTSFYNLFRNRNLKSIKLMKHPLVPYMFAMAIILLI